MWDGSDTYKADTKKEIMQTLHPYRMNKLAGLIKGWAYVIIGFIISATAVLGNLIGSLSEPSKLSSAGIFGGIVFACIFVGPIVIVLGLIQTFMSHTYKD